MWAISAWKVCSVFLTAPSTVPGAKQVFNDYFLNGELSFNTPSLQKGKLRFPEFHWFTPLLFTPWQSVTLCFFCTYTQFFLYIPWGFIKFEPFAFRFLFMSWFGYLLSFRYHSKRLDKLTSLTHKNNPARQILLSPSQINSANILAYLPCISHWRFYSE